MTEWLPEPVDLDLPPENPTALGDVVAAVTGAAFCVGVLGAHLAGPEATTPGWAGADAAAAAEQTRRTAALARDVHGALTAAVARLAAHIDRLVETIGRVRALRAAQIDEFGAAWSRLTGLEGRTAALALEDPEMLALAAELRRAEAARVREHALLLAELAADAAATAGELARASEVVGGTATPGDGGRVLMRLADALPGWGDREVRALATLGEATGERLRGASPTEVTAVLRESEQLLAAPPFAAAVLRVLGAEAVAAFVQWAGIADGADPLGRLLGLLVGGAAPAARRDPELRRVIYAPFDGALSATTAVGLGRMAAGGGLPADYLQRIVGRLVLGERDEPTFRRDEQAVAPAEDPLAQALGGLAGCEVPDAAAAVLRDATIWPVLLDRVWTEGTTPLENLIRQAAGSAALGGAVTRTVLEAIGATADGLAEQVVSGSPEAFTVMAISPAVAVLTAAHLAAVAGPIAAAQGGVGVPAVALGARDLQRLAGLGIVTVQPDARDTILRSLAAATAAGVPEVGAGQAAAAFVHGGVFAAIAFGEHVGIRHTLYAAAERAVSDARSWTVITAGVSGAPAKGVAATLRDLAGVGASFVGPGGVPLEAFLAQPATGDRQAAFAVVAAGLPPLVGAGLLPDPAGALSGGLGTTAAAGYVAGLDPAQRELWQDLVGGAQSGYLTVGDALGILPGS